MFLQINQALYNPWSAKHTFFRFWSYYSFSKKWQIKKKWAYVFSGFALIMFCFMWVFFRGG